MLLEKKKITREAAMTKLSDRFSAERKGSILDSAMQSYKSHQAAKGVGGTETKKGIMRGASSVNVRHLHAADVDTHVNADAAGASLKPGDKAMAKCDSACEQTMFNDAAFFPFGVKPCEVSTYIVPATGPKVLADGVGTAYILQTTEDGAPIMVAYPNSILCKALKDSLISIEQAWDAQGVKYRFAGDRDILFPSCHKVWPVSVRLI